MIPKQAVSSGCYNHYSLLVCSLKMDSHSRIILILLLFSDGRGNSEVSKEVNQPSQSGNSTESWEPCFCFIEDTAWCNSNRKTWEMENNNACCTVKAEELQYCRLWEQGVEGPAVDELSSKSTNMTDLEMDLLECCDREHCTKYTCNKP